MKIQSTNKIWGLIAYLFLYFGLALPGPMFYSGACGPDDNIFYFFCQPTDGYIYLDKINYFFRGMYSISMALIVYAHWSRKIVILFLFGCLYYPLNDLYIYVLEGTFGSFYYITSPMVGIFSQISTLFLYTRLEIFLMLIGSLISVLLYGALYSYFKGNQRLIVPVYTSLLLLIFGLYISIIKSEFQSVTIQSYIIFIIAIIFGLRYWLKSYNKHSKKEFLDVA